MSTRPFLSRHPLLRFSLWSIKFGVSVTLLMLIVGTVAVLGGYFYFARDLPNITNLDDYRPPVVTEVFSNDGKKIGEFWIERRLLATLDEIPKVLTNAFIASEDARFFEHKGVDPLGIARALWEDVKAGGMVQGGSTITQQLTRALLLTRERKLARKVREAILATRLERNLNKEQILTLYLNQIFLGNRSYGVRAAAENYFHKELPNLTLPEASMLAGLSKGPSDDDPTRNPARAKERQRQVLERMHDQGYITDAEMRAALTAPLKIYIAGIDKDYNRRLTPWFTEHIRRMLLEQFGEEKLYTGGMRVEATVDVDKYHAAERAVRDGLEAVDHRTRGWRGPLATHVTAAEITTLTDDVHQQALADAGDPWFHIPPAPEDELLRTGPTPLTDWRNYRAVVLGKDAAGYSVQVGHNRGVIPADKAKWVGRALEAHSVVEVRSLGDDKYQLVQTPEVQGAMLSMEVATGRVLAMIGGYDASSEWNRATQSLRQPGSSFKPFVYAAALDKGFTYDTPVADSPVAFRMGREVWSPKNYGNSYSGSGPFWQHLTYSRNVPTVKIAHAIGLHYLTGFVRKLGLTSPVQKYLSMALGANGLYLNEIVRAYCTFASYGRNVPQLFITRITDPKGHVLQEAAALPTDIPAVATGAAKSQVPETMNQSLWDAAQPWIAKDKLDLDPQEMQVLYGSVIPDGYLLTPQTAYLVVGLMRRVVEQGTATRVKALGRPVAGKTGTTNDESDTWFVGYTPQIATGVWVGHDEVKKIGSGEQGGRTAAPIFLQYMQYAVKDLPIVDFTPPDGLSKDKLASLAGGSALYWKGGTKDDIEEEAAATATTTRHRVTDRAVNFFQEDIGGL